MTTPSDQEMLEINTFKSLIHRAIQFEYASWCKERDKKRAREISLESGNEDKDASELLQYDEYAFESYVIREVDQEFRFRNESLAKAGYQISCPLPPPDFGHPRAASAGFYPYLLVS